MTCRGSRAKMMKVDKMSRVFSSRCFLKEIENMFSVFLSSYRKNR